MAVSITFDFNDAQQARIQQARAVYNTEHNTDLTPKQYLLTIIKDTVKQSVINAEVKAALAGTAAQVETAVDADLQGNA
jgi:hypothetical protein